MEQEISGVDFVAACREAFPVEWQVFTFPEFNDQKEAVYFPTYFLYNDTPLRHDYEVDYASMQEMGGFTAMPQKIREYINADIASGAIDEIVRELNDQAH